MIKLRISNKDFRILSQIANEEYAVDKMNDVYENETVEKYNPIKQLGAEQ